MKKPFHALVMGLLLCAIVWAGPAHAKRVALLIGNAKYSVGALSNPPSDVREIQAALKAVGFDDIKVVQDADQKAMKKAIRDFGDKAEGADLAFLYYSGHGTQANGRNYLIPINASIDKESDYEIEAVAANGVLEQIAGARPKAAVVVLDACRDNPVATVRSGTKGLGRMDAPTGTMIAFSTAPNKTASDEGYYARVLAQQIRTPGLELLDVFRRTTAEVRKLSQGRQEPRVSEVSISDAVYFSNQQLASLDPVPVRPRPNGPTGGAANFGDLEQAQKEEAASRQQWAAWLARMKADFKKAQGFKGNGQYEAQAWDRFLSAYAEDDPYSNEDEALRAQAEQSRSAAQQQAAPVPPAVPAPATTFSSNAAPTGNTIKVGILHSLSGTMAISETVLKDVVLMTIDEINAKGGVLGKKLEPVVVDPASNWPLFAERAKQLLVQDKVAVIFGCWTSVSRKSVLPVLRANGGLLFYPVQYEGEELDNNAFYTGAVPNQQAIPAAQYLLGADGGSARRFVLIGTDFVYSRTNNKILRAYLKSKGVGDSDIMEQYTPFGHGDYQSIVASIRRFASEGKKTAIISSIYGDSNIPFYRELSQQGLMPRDLVVAALSVGEEELRGVDLRSMVGHLSVANYFMSIKNPSNEQFVRAWTAYAKAKGVPGHNTKPLTSDAMEATYIGVNMWAQAVKKAGTTDVNQVREAMAGQTFKAPNGYMVTMDKNHHLQKPVFVSEIKPDGQFRVVWKTMAPLAADPWSPYLPH